MYLFTNSSQFHILKICAIWQLENHYLNFIEYSSKFLKRIHQTKVQQNVSSSNTFIILTLSYLLIQIIKVSLHKKKLIKNSIIKYTFQDHWNRSKSNLSTNSQAKRVNRIEERDTLGGRETPPINFSGNWNARDHLHAYELQHFWPRWSDKLPAAWWSIVMSRPRSVQ